MVCMYAYMTHILHSVDYTLVKCNGGEERNERREEGTKWNSRIL